MARKTKEVKLEQVTQRKQVLVMLKLTTRYSRPITRIQENGKEMAVPRDAFESPCPFPVSYLIDFKKFEQFLHDSSKLDAYVSYLL